MSQYASQNVLILVLSVLFDICNGTALKYLVGGDVLQQNNDFIISHPFSRQVRYYNERPVYRSPVPRVEYANSPPLLIGNYAEPLYQPGYRVSANTFLSTGYEQDFQPSGFQDVPYPPKIYDDSYMPQDSHYGPPKPEPPTTTEAPVVATPCTCHPFTPSQPLPEGAPGDMYLPPEMTVAPETEAPTTPEPTTTTEAPPPPPPANTYLPVEVEPRTMSTPAHGIQGPTPLPEEPEPKHGYVYPHPNPIFHPETTTQPPETTTQEPTTEKPEAPAAPPPVVVGGYQPIYLLPIFPAHAGFQSYGGQLPQTNVAYPPPVAQNGGEGVVINIPSRTYLPPKS